MADLDLKGGQEPEEDERGNSGRRGQSERSQRRHRADIRERLFAIFDRLADSLEGRGDAELAGIIREDSRAMVNGLASLVKRAPGFGPPIMGLLAVLEPLLAFGRILRLLGRRWRERRLEEREAYDPGLYEADHPQPEPEEPEPERETAEPWRLAGE